MNITEMAKAVSLMEDLPVHIVNELGLSQLVIANISEHTENQLLKVLNEKEFLNLPLVAYEKEYWVLGFNDTMTYHDYLRMLISQHIRKVIEHRINIVKHHVDIVSYPIGYTQGFFNKKLNAYDTRSKGDWEVNNEPIE